MNIQIVEEDTAGCGSYIDEHLRIRNADGSPAVTDDWVCPECGTRHDVGECQYATYELQLKERWKQ